MTKPRLGWDSGTAYDLFASLCVLHDPADYGLRPQWAAGVRARIPADERKILEEGQLVLFSLPLHWIHSLPKPKDATAALWELRRTPPAERLSALTFPPGVPTAMSEILRDAVTDHGWGREEKEMLRQREKGCTFQSITRFKRSVGSSCYCRETQIRIHLRVGIRDFSPQDEGPGI